MAGISKFTGHPKSKTPSPPNSPSHSISPIPWQEVEKSNTTSTAETLNTLDNSSPKPHGV